MNKQLRISVVSFRPPTKHNLGAPTALPYQILKHAPPGAEIELYYYPGLSKHQEIIQRDIDQLRLNKTVEIRHSPDSIQTRLLRRGLSLKRFLRNCFRWGALPRELPWGVAAYSVNEQVLAQIREFQPHLVWLYPYWLIDWIDKIQCERIVITGPDSAALHSERVIRFGKWDTASEILPELYQLQRNINLETALGKTRAKVHMVGQADIDKYNFLTGRCDQAFFVPYPYHDYTPSMVLHTATQGKLRVLVSAGNQLVYVGTHLSTIVDAIITLAEALTEHYEFIFLGEGYEPFVARLRSAGFQVAHEMWVENYADTVAQTHVQIIPRAVGTGTKGKTLHALVTGLIVIGSEFAYENIAVVPGEDCLEYHRPEDVAGFLTDIWHRRAYYVEMANRSAIKTRRNHDPQIVCKAFWDKCLDNND